MPEPRIRLYWSKRENSLMGDNDEGAGRGTVIYLFSLFDKDVRDELERRGYDLTTLRFQIRKKPDA